MEVKKEKRPFYETKDTDGDPQLSQFPEEMKAVAKEIKAIGKDTKEAIDQMGKEHKLLKDEIDKLGNTSLEKASAYTTEKIDKLAELVATRQDELDKGNQKRMDELDLAMQRVGKMSDGGPEGEEFKEAQAFTIAIMGRKGVKIEGHGLDEDQVDIKQYIEYTKAFNDYIHMGGSFTDAQMSPAMAKALNIGADPDGGILVPPDLSARIIERIRESDPIRALATTETISGTSFEIMEDLDEAGDGWADERTTNDITDTPTWKKVAIPTHFQEARPLASQQSLDDPTRNLEQWLNRMVSRKFSRSEAAAFVTGDGVNRPKGFLTYASTSSEFEFNKIQQVAMGAANALTTDGYIDVKYSMVEDMMELGTWLMNRSTVAATMKLKDGDGQYIWRAGLQPGQPSTILALPLRMSTTMPAIAVNSLSVVLAAWRDAYTIVDRQGITVQRDPFTKKPFVEFYTRRRIGGGVVNFQAIKIGKISV